MSDLIPGEGTRMPKTDDLRPMTEIQVLQTRAFVDGLQSASQTYWDLVNVGDVLERDLHITPELVILYADGVEDYNPWYEGWRMDEWHSTGYSPFGHAIVPPMLVSHFVLSVQFDHTKPFPVGSIHTIHDTRILAPIRVGATVRIRTEAIDKSSRRGRRYLRHDVTVTDIATGEVCFRELRDILSL